ncbi:MAG: M14 family zinc carboxypeptidase [Saprospiraceae bacterium]
MKLLIYLLLSISISALSAQSEWLLELERVHKDYQVDGFEERRFKHEHVMAVLEKLPATFTVVEEGQSVEGRGIYSVRIGNGSMRVLLWSQMHGDEATATAALMDIFHFFSVSGDRFDAFRQKILSQLTLVFIPMLNPDGAAAFQRRNAWGIDINRDALRLTSPEARILKRVRDDWDAQWGFNLHDQSRFYGAGRDNPEVATLSFLAPAYNEAKSINPVRERAIQLIAQLNQQLQSLIPNGIARYNDTFEPRAFGDNMQLWGTSTILIESGGYLEDREKQTIRKLNFATLLAAFHSIANQSYRSFALTDYQKIPFNKSDAYHDLLLREVRFLPEDGEPYLVDIAFRGEERSYRDSRAFYLLGSISDVGDLTYVKGYEELPPSRYTAEVGAVYPRVFTDIDAVREVDAMALLREGVAVVMTQKSSPPWVKATFPVWVVGAEGLYDKDVLPGQNPPLIIRNEAGKVVYAVINGRLIMVA